MTNLFTITTPVGSIDSVPCSTYAMIGKIQKGCEAPSVIFIVIVGVSMLGLIRVVWMKEWLTLDVLVLVSLSRISTLVDILLQLWVFNLSFSFDLRHHKIQICLYPISTRLHTQHGYWYWENSKRKDTSITKSTCRALLIIAETGIITVVLGRERRAGLPILFCLI
ncbi:unnamed protein product [Vicia faba]|uniref:Uncharacterized protein n=1 Tax=Vicia faba TaxID=3906 RepID=A0AAV0YQ84_VICFA|nr:unnamed protein product [Vicia faba]